MTVSSSAILSTKTTQEVKETCLCQQKQIEVYGISNTNLSSELATQVWATSTALNWLTDRLLNTVLDSFPN